MVYYANYFRFMERSRTEWIRSMGIEQDRLLQQARRIFVVADTQAEFRRPALFNDQLVVTAELLSRSRASFVIRQDIFRDALDGECVCTGTVRAAFLDADTRKPVRLPDSLFKETTT